MVIYDTCNKLYCKWRVNTTCLVDFCIFDLRDGGGGGGGGGEEEV